MINFSNVQYHYHQERFNFDLDIEAGSVVAVLGASGAGKSTLLHLAAGFIDPVVGDICVEGARVNGLAPHQRPLSMLFQEHNLFAHLSVADNIGLGLEPSLKLSLQQQKKVAEVAKQVGVDGLMTRLPEQLSGGQKQRVALARCFAQERALLLLDEPFSALDPVLREEMLLTVKQLAEMNQVTVLMVTHHISDALNIASHYAFIEQGAIASFDSIEKLTAEHPLHSLGQFVKSGQ
jgi:thiamine transport system ATP-binding protein